MALLFCAGFDHLAQTDLFEGFLAGWYSTLSFYINLTTTNARRTGVKVMQLDGGAVAYVMFPAPIVGDYCIFGLAFRMEATNPSSGNEAWFGVGGKTGTQCGVRILNGGAIEFQRGKGALGTQLAVTPANYISAATYYYLEVKVRVHNTLGSYEVKLNGSTILSGSGVDTQYQSNDDLNAVWVYTGNHTGNGMWIGDVYILDTSGNDNIDFLGDIRVDTLMPNGVGNKSQWTPSAGDNYACVDESTPNDDTDYVETDVLNEIDTYAFGNLSALATAVKAVALNFVGKKTDSGVLRVSPVMRGSSADYVLDSSGLALGSTYSHKQMVWQENPVDSSAFAEADVNSGEFGIKLVG
ncbi:MAG: hypothetical protein ACYSW3_00220 [Planctomycetota bacterium]|jgi:hypothetical protein